MKHWKRILSLFCACLMLAAMLPTGMLQASALNYAKSEFWISNLSDWNDIASSSENFRGKTVHLMNDFDAEGAELTTLFESFAGTFDGQGYTIKNFTAKNAILAEKTLSGAVIKNLKVQGSVLNDDEGVLAVGRLVAEHDDTAPGTLTITNVTVLQSAVVGASQHVGGIVGALTLRDGQSATLSNIIIDGQVVNKRQDLTHACISAGGVVGIFEPIGHPELNIKNVTMTSEVWSRTSTVGGILGAVF